MLFRSCRESKVSIQEKINWKSSHYPRLHDILTIKEARWLSSNEYNDQSWPFFSFSYGLLNSRLGSLEKINDIDRAAFFCSENDLQM